MDHSLGLHLKKTQKTRLKKCFADCSQKFSSSAERTEATTSGSCPGGPESSPSGFYSVNLNDALNPYETTPS